MSIRVMTAGAIGGMFTIGSAILIVATIAIGASGRSVGLGSIGAPEIGGAVLLAAIVLAIVGLATIGIVGPRPLNSGTIRGGLCVLALGLFGIAASSLVGMTLGYDPLENWPVVIAGLAGLIGVAVGVPLTIAGLLRAPGMPRRLALLFLAGLVLVVVAGNVVVSLLANGAVHDPARLPYVGGLAALLLGAASIIAAVAGTGWLAIVGDRGSKPAATFAP